MKSKSTFFLYLVLLTAIAVLIFSVYTSFKSNQVYEVDDIRVPQSLVDSLNRDYINYTTEFAYCLYGGVINRTLIITDFSLPNQVNYLGEDSADITCQKNAVGTIHKHKPTACVLSMQDYYTFGATRDTITGIICGQHNIAFYSSNSLSKKLNSTIY